MLELIAAAALGLLLLWLVFGGQAPGPDLDDEIGELLEETPRGRALLAIKELEFDRETGKVSDLDFQALRAQLSREAVRHLDLEAGTEPVQAEAGSGGQPVRSAELSLPPTCQRCGPRPERKARYCSGCGGALKAA